MVATRCQSRNRSGLQKESSTSSSFHAISLCKANPFVPIVSGQAGKQNNQADHACSYVVEVRLLIIVYHDLDLCRFSWQNQSTKSSCPCHAFTTITTTILTDRRTRSPSGTCSGQGYTAHPSQNSADRRRASLHCRLG